MALKSSREGLRKELVDYLGNIIIDENLKQNIINSVDDVFINNETLIASVNELNGKIRNESSAREGADITLQEHINAEANIRENTDNTLQNNINTESIARQEAITNIENLINNGVLKLDLLWTNASSTSAFTPQSISLDTSVYKMLAISAKGSTTSAQEITLFITYTPSTNQLSFIDYMSGCIVQRVVTVDNNAIIFSEGYTINTYHSQERDDSRAIPTRIFGVK